MLDKLLTALLIMIWIAFFGYLIYQGLFAVVIISFIILAVALSFASNE
jgi:hypothetical protein